ncbi:MAG: DUF2452 domain-containing protein [Gammaproteobacteria bacterium]
MSDSSKKHLGGDRSSPYPVSRLSPQVELVDLARQISTADAMINTRVSAKLKVIADQIRLLQTEARSVLESAQQDQELHRAECNFKRIPGRIYHLYRKATGRSYFSMLSPDDWGAAPPHEFIDSYKLENDLSWTPVDQLHHRDDSRELIDRLLLEKGFRG